MGGEEARGITGRRGEVEREGEEIDLGILDEVDVEGDGTVEKLVMVLLSFVVAPEAGGMK